ncbi:MAG: hypothetical protein ACOCYX_07290 [Spirochaetota bacterium]
MNGNSTSGFAAEADAGVFEGPFDGRACVGDGGIADERCGEAVRCRWQSFYELHGVSDAVNGLRYALLW